MSIIKAQIRLKPVSFTGNTSGNTVINNFVSIKIPFGNSDNFLGLQQEIDAQTQFVTNELINPAVDEERIRYKATNTPTDAILSFWFYNGTYVNTFVGAGFTTNEFQGNADNFTNSFFILDLYNTYDIFTQTKIFTTYLTKKGNTIPQYKISASTNQFYYLHIPMSYITNQTGETSICYAKFMFYNAKEGNVATFYNSDNSTATNGSRIHFQIELNHVTKTWRFVAPFYPNIWAYQITNDAYTTKVDNTVDNTNVSQATPPSGTTFDYTGSRIVYRII